MTRDDLDPLATYTASDVARILGRHAKTVRRWCERGHIAAYRPGPGHEWNIPGHEAIRVCDPTRVVQVPRRRSRADRERDERKAFEEATR